MFGLFKKSSGSHGGNLHEQSLILESNFGSDEEFGTTEERTALETLEEELTVSLEEIGAEFDGHDVGDSSFTLYMYGENVDEMLKKVESILRASDFDRFEVTKRYGPPEGSNSKEKRFTLLW